jgi:hypothetical protein
MDSQAAAIRRSAIRGYVAFVICGLCVAMNILAYLPSQTFEASEATEFTVTLALLGAFLISSVVAWIYAVKNRRDAGLVALLLLSASFVASSYFWGAFRSQTRTALQLSYAIVVLALAPIRIVTLRRSAV